MWLCSGSYARHLGPYPENLNELSLSYRVIMISVILGNPLCWAQAAIHFQRPIQEDLIPTSFEGRIRFNQQHFDRPQLKE